VRCSIAQNMLVYYGYPEAAEFGKATSGQIQDGERRPNWTYLNRNNSSSDCFITPPFDTTEFDHVTDNTL